jgi:hypothetical protein
MTEYFDLILWMGDLNYRIESNLEHIHKCLLNMNILELREYDQFTIEKRSNRININGFKEKEISFLPTYKYNTKEDVLVISKKRPPGWTDRFLFKTKLKHFQVIEYNSIKHIIKSDHKPVYFICNITIPEYNGKLKQNDSFPFDRKCSKKCFIFLFFINLLTHH